MRPEQDGPRTNLEWRRILDYSWFWLRPDFILRCVGRFRALGAFDRSIALAASAFTAVIPLAILVGSLLGSNSEATADRLVERFNLSSAGAAAVRSALAPPEGLETGFSVLSGVLLLIAALGFARAMQRLIESAWSLSPLSVRNTRNAAVWILGLSAYAIVVGAITSIDGSLIARLVSFTLAFSLGIGFALWTGRLLSGRRIATRDLLAFAVLVAAGAAIYAVVSSLWVPATFNNYAIRYGVIGATFAMISALFGWALVLVAMTALAREIDHELVRIRKGERPRKGALRQEWQNFIGDLRSNRKEMPRSPSDSEPPARDD